jgi:hypothetical protein
MQYSIGIMSLSATLVTFTGVVLILHSAFSCLHYRGLVVELPDMPIPPLDVKVEVGVGFLLALFGQLMDVGPLRSILGNKGMIKQYLTRDFDHYQNRATAMSRSKAK